MLLHIIPLSVHMQASSGLPTCTRYSADQLACLFQCKLGLCPEAVKQFFAKIEAAAFSSDYWCLLWKPCWVWRLEHLQMRLPLTSKSFLEVQVLQSSEIREVVPVEKTSSAMIFQLWNGFLKAAGLLLTLMCFWYQANIFPCIVLLGLGMAVKGACA